MANIKEIPMAPLNPIEDGIIVPDDIKITTDVKKEESKVEEKVEETPVE